MTFVEREEGAQGVSPSAGAESLVPLSAEFVGEQSLGATAQGSHRG